MEVGSKRKRDLECPRITYHAPGRTFDRLFREDSLQQLEDVVRKKLGVASDTGIYLAQIRGDAYIDLEDEDDFDAFYNTVHSSLAASIRVIFKDNVTSPNIHAQESKQAAGRKKRKLLPEDAPPLPPTGPLSQASETSGATTDIRPAKKRGVSFAQSSGVSKPAEGAQAAEPPTKRPRTTTTAPESMPQIDQLPKRNYPSHKAKTVPEYPLPDVTSLPSVTPSTSASTQKTGVIEKKSTKPKSKKGADFINSPLPGSALATLQAKRGEIREFQEKGKAGKAGKQKNESGLESGESGKGQLLANNAKESVTSEATSAPLHKISDATTQITSSVVQQLPVKETVPRHSEKDASERDTKLKSKRVKSVKNAEQANTQVLEKPKKTVKSSSKVREATIVNSETSDAVTSEAQSGGHLTAISRSIIEKYLPSSPLIVAADNAKSSESGTFQPAPDVQTAPAPPKPTCPYCGKALTHDRSRCPVIRAKFPKVIEDRIAKLKLDGSEDPEGVRAHAIMMLEAAVQRKFGAETQKSPNVSPSDISSSTELAPLSHRTPSVAPKGPKTNPATKASFSVCQPSPSSPSTSEEEIPLRKASSSLLLAIQNSFNTSRPGLRKSGRPESPSHSEGGHNFISTHAMPQPQKGNNKSEGSSEGEVPQFGYLPENSLRESTSSEHGDDDSETSGSSGNESTSLQPQPLSEPDLQASFPPLADVLGYSDKDLETLIRGPGVPLKPADLPSSSTSPESSDNEGLDDIQLENGLEQDEPEDRTQKARQAFMPSDDSSDENADANNEMQDEVLHPRSTLISIPPVVAPPGERAAEARFSTHGSSRESPSFRKMGVRTSSAEPDEAKNKAFEDVLAQENAALGLSRHESTPQKLNATIFDTSRASDQRALEITSAAKEPESVHIEEPNGMDLRNGHAPDDAPTQNLGPEYREAAENLETEPLAETQSLSLLEDTQDGTSFIPSTTVGQPQEVSARASTPKPGIMQRMRNRVGLASPVKKPSSSLLPTVTPNTKLPRTTIASLRSQRKPRTRSQNVELGHEGDAETTIMAVAGKSASKRGTVTAPTKSMSARSKLPEKDLKEVVENQEQSKPLPRRSSRTVSKGPGASSHAAPIVPFANPLPSRRTRRSKPTPESEEPTKASQPQAGKATMERKQLKELTVTAGSPSSTSRSEEANPVTPGAQSDEQVQEITLPSRTPMSLQGWETLEAETPPGTAQSDPMVDELHSDMDPIPFPLKPQYQRKVSSFGQNQSFSRLDQALHNPANREAEGEKGNGEINPLFILNESQTPFPHPKAPTLVATDSSDSENEVQKAVATGRHSTQPQVPRYRRLSDFAGQATRLFTPRVLRQSTGLPQAATVPTKRKDRLHQLYGKMGKQDSHDEVSDYESGPDSDSETDNVSHIPKSRKAGAGLKGGASVL